MIKQRSKMRRQVPLFRVQMGPGGSYSQLTTMPEIVEAVIEETVCAIKDSISKRKKSAAVFELAGSEFNIEIEKDKWKPSLENAMEHYIKKEDYIKCAEIRELIKKLG